MQYKTHQIGGICAGIIAAVSMVPEPYTPVAVGTMSVIVLSSAVGSVLPDIDEPNSIAGRKVWLIAKIIKKVFGHRMITHTPVFVLALAVGFYMIGQNYVIQTEYFDWYYFAVMGFLVGYISHFVMDSLNPTGIMYLWPLSRQRFSIMKLRTGDKEWIARWIFILITFAYVYFLKFSESKIFYNFAQEIISIYNKLT